MPANTPRGYPYPVGTDRVMDGDDAIHNLATAVDTRLGVSATGTVTHPFNNATQSVVAVTFPAGRFVNPPVAVLQSLIVGAGAGASGMWLRLNGAPTATGFSSVLNTGAAQTATFTAYWHAVEQG
jgi:hypothetical protein